MEKRPQAQTVGLTPIVSTAMAMLKIVTMIIACPACATRYVVPDTAIGVDGRTVRCAKCRHSWFQQGSAAEVEAAPQPAPAPEPVASPSEVEPSVPAAGVDAVRAVSPVESDDQADQAPPVRSRLSFARKASASVDHQSADDREWDRPGGDFSRSQDEDESYASAEDEQSFRPSRNPLRLWTAAAVAFAVVVSALAGSVWWFGLPDWLPGGGPAFGKNIPGLELSFPATRQDRRTLPNGAEYFGATGTITNNGKAPVKVPPLLIVLLDSQKRVIDHREIAPPKRTLQPGESVTVNEALTDVPREVVGADIGWKAE